VASSAERRFDDRWCENREKLVPEANRAHAIAWKRGLLYALVGAVLGVVLSLVSGFIGTPWQGALVLGAIGAVVGLVQPPLNRAVRKSVHRDLVVGGPPASWRTPNNSFWTFLWCALRLRCRQVRDSCVEAVIEGDEVGGPLTGELVCAAAAPLQPALQTLERQPTRGQFAVQRGGVGQLRGANVISGNDGPIRVPCRERSTTSPASTETRAR
jgi:hypothetical protein